MGWTGKWWVDLPLAICVLYTLSHTAPSFFRTIKAWTRGE